MSLTSGFFNSINKDRLYDAEQVSNMFDGVVQDGIFKAIGNKFAVNAYEGMQVTVGSGRAWFNKTWTLNDGTEIVDISPAPLVGNRIDVVALKIDSSSSVRANSIEVIEGQTATTPVAPTWTNTDDIHYYALAHVYVYEGVTEIVQDNITNKIGTTETPWAATILSSESSVTGAILEINPPDTSSLPDGSIWIETR